MNTSARQILKRLGRTMGLEIRPNSILSREDLRLFHFLELHGVNTVLDVGANDGGFARSLFSAGFKGRIVSFEPLPNAYSRLLVSSSRNPNWAIAPRMALSDENGTAEFNVTQADTASSLLSPSPQFVSETPQVAVTETIEVQTRRLDDVEELAFDYSSTLLKLDVQGAEAKVLAGASRSMEKVRGVLCEMSLVSIYDGQPDWITLDQQIRHYGLEAWDIWPGHRKLNGRLAQIDGLYFRP